MTSPLYLFLHIYKTGGQTIVANIEPNYTWRQRVSLYVGPLGLDQKKSGGSPANPGWDGESVKNYIAYRYSPAVRCVMGHLLYVGIHERIPGDRPIRYVTFLREPVERIISLYSYLKYHSDSHWHDEIVESGWDLSEWMEKSRALWAHNGQVRQLLLSDSDPYSARRELTRADLEAAKERLAQFWFIGLTEHLRWDASYLYGKMRLYKFARQSVVNATTKKEKVSQRVRNEIAAANALDIELYEYATQLRSRFLRTHLLNYPWNVFRAQVRQVRYERARHT